MNLNPERTRKRFLLLLAISGLPAAMACGLVKKASTTTVCNDLGTFEASTDRLSALWSAPAAATMLPVVPCLPGEDQCGDQLAQLAAVQCKAEGCSLICNSNDICALRLTLSQYQEVNLAPSIHNQFAAAAVHNVTLEQLQYTVTENTLSQDTPPVAVYAGGQTAAKSTDSGVAHITDVPAVRAGTTPSETLTLDSAGTQRLTALVADYQTPFRLLEASTFNIEGGSRIPTGAMQVSFRGCFAVELL